MNMIKIEFSLLKGNAYKGKLKIYQEHLHLFF